MFALTAILLFICSSATATQDSALLEYPDGTKGECTKGAFKTFMGPNTTPHDVSSPYQTRHWWFRERDHMLQNTLEPDQALRIIIKKNKQWILETFPRWAKVVDLSEYDKLPHLSDDLPNAQPWRKVISGMIALSALHEIAEMPNASQTFNEDYQPDNCGASHENTLIMMLDSFPENFKNGWIDDMLFVVNNILRYTKIQPVAMFCDQLIFPIPSFLTGLYEGRMIFPVTLYFKNSHKWGAHQNTIIGLPNLLYHDFFTHGNSLMVAEQLGPALFDQPDNKPFLQSWTQHAFFQMLKTMAHPHIHTTVDKEFSFSRRCVSIANTSVALLFHGVHEVPANITNPHYLAMPFITADNELRDFNKTVFKDAVQNIDIVRDPKEEARAYASIPFDHEALKNPCILTRTCLKTWINIEEDSCSFQRMIQMFQAIQHLIVSQHHNSAYCANPLKNIPLNIPILKDFTVSCALFNGLTAMFVHDSLHSITLLVPNPESLAHLSEENARIALQALRETVLVFQKRSYTMMHAESTLSFNVNSAFFRNVINNACPQEKYDCALTYAGGSPSPITKGMGETLVNNLDLQSISTASSFEELWHQCLKNIHNWGKPASETPSQDMQVYILKTLSVLFPIFPKASQKESFNPPDCIQGTIERHWYRSLAFSTVQEMRSKYKGVRMDNEDMLLKIKQAWKDNPEQLQELTFLQNFPNSFLTHDIHMALFIIAQLKQVGLDVQLIRTKGAAVPVLTFLAALHEGIVLLPRPEPLSESHLLSSHNGQYHGLTDILIKKEILGYLQAILTTEQHARTLFPQVQKPFLQHWVRERMANIQQNIANQHGTLFEMGQHLDPDKAFTHITLAELLKLYQETHEATLLIPATMGTPSALDNDDNYMILAQSIFGPLLEPHFSPTEQVRFIKDYLTHSSLPQPNHTPNEHTLTCQREWLPGPFVPGKCNIFLLRNLINTAIQALEGVNTPPITLPRLTSPHHQYSIQCVLSNTTLIMPIQNGLNIIVPIPTREAVERTTTQQDQHIMINSSHLSLEYIAQLFHSGTAPWHDFLTRVFAHNYPMQKYDWTDSKRKIKRRRLS